ncbi:MAG TPA: Rieske 2Fe-2S domain-containing protein [Candidatus Thermoplasmatota archaeon]|jgi:3-phenylpropionate/trans-cinnamate dioxygenase ferredoxin subunit|nr:Rieske 2Fe-2S domain-containing protein [Candidatus Thermoplasmatota archaeon]
MGAFAQWKRRRKAREVLRSGDRWVCPYCREVHPQFEVGGTRFGFGYPSVKFACCGRVAFMLKDPKTQELKAFTRIGDGHAEWMTKEAYFAWQAESSKARGRREDSVHKELLANEPPRSPRAPKPLVQDRTPAAEEPRAAPAPAKPLAFIAVAKLDELPAQGGKVVVVNGQRIALFRVGADVHALRDACAHQGRSLGGSALEDGIVTCQGHGWRYDVRTGKVEHNPALGVPRFEVKLEDGKVLVAA